MEKLNEICEVSEYEDQREINKELHRSLRKC